MEHPMEHMVAGARLYKQSPDCRPMLPLPHVFARQISTACDVHQHLHGVFRRYRVTADKKTHLVQNRLTALQRQRCLLFNILN